MTLGAVALGNVDPIAQHAMRATVDGEVALGIRDVAYSTILKSGGKDGKFTAILAKSEKPRAIMEFADIDTAGGVINGTLDAMTAVSTGRLETKGHMLMLDNFNKLAAILPKYLS